jgi:hypothetical protein
MLLHAHTCRRAKVNIIVGSSCVFQPENSAKCGLSATGYIVGCGKDTVKCR